MYKNMSPRDVVDKYLDEDGFRLMIRSYVGMNATPLMILATFYSVMLALEMATMAIAVGGDAFTISRAIEICLAREDEFDEISSAAAVSGICHQYAKLYGHDALLEMLEGHLSGPNLREVKEVILPLVKKVEEEMMEEERS